MNQRKSLKASSKETPKKKKGEASLVAPKKTPTNSSAKSKEQKPTAASAPSSSVTRSGRKVRRPQEWWANAHEHLAGGHKESSIKYKWGSGDVILVKGDKRVKLADIYLKEDGDVDLASSSDSTSKG
ncbi:hypothetical protein GGI12_003587 [Dipsacomyces acuminosporus]|nr:hypothetical protein GGI12_003587 [Dipsacomyces acuminosporus]